MLSMTDFAEGFSFTAHPLLSVFLHNQAITVTAPTDLLRHSSCEYHFAIHSPWEGKESITTEPVFQAAKGKIALPTS
jgi:hypothetical protein